MATRAAPLPTTRLRGPRPLPAVRVVAVVAHRWAGLSIALFLVVAGLTGAVMPWQAELERLARPALSAATPPTPGAPVLDGIALAERVERETGAHVGFIPLAVAPDHVAKLSVTGAPGEARAFDTVWVDPYTGKVRLSYRDGVLADGAQTIPAFLFAVHRELALGRFGQTMLGIAALIWTIDCFVGFYLTLPVRTRASEASTLRRRGWLARWRPAWRVRRRARGHKLHFDVHRAAGLWLWPMLFVFAWSSVGFNLRQVADPVMRAFGAAASAPLPMAPQPADATPMGPRAARRQGDRLLAAIGRRDGFRLQAPSALVFYPKERLYRYMVRSDLDVVSEGGRTAVYFNAFDGRLLLFEPPVERDPADGFMRWLFMLHLAQVFGLPYRIVVSIIGLMVAALSVTGVLIWTKRRSARHLRELGRPGRNDRRTALYPNQTPSEPAVIRKRAK